MIGSGDLGMGVAIYLDDDFTESSKRVGDEVTGLENKFKSAAEGIEAGLGQIQTGLGGLLAAGAIVAPFGIAIMKSAELSDALADVTKTTGIAGQELQFLRGHLEGIDTRTSVEGLLEMAKAGGSMGIAQKDIASFTESVDKLNVALGDQFASPEVLARDLTKMRNVLKDIQTDNVSDDLLHIGNVLNYMGANAAATEGDISDVVGRMAGLGGALGMTTASIFGASTALLEMGVSAEVAGTNFPLILARMANDIEGFAEIAGMKASDFKNLVDTDIVGAFQAVAKGAKNIAPTASSMATLLDSVGLSGGRVSEVFLKAADSGDLMTKRMQEASDALGNTDSIMGEFNAKNETLAAVLDKAGKASGILVTRIGDALAPAVEIVVGLFTDALGIFSAIVSNPLGKWLVGIAAGVAGLVAATMAWQAIQLFIVPGFYALAGAAWAALTPLLPFIAAGAAIAGMLYGLSEALNSNNEDWVKFGLVMAGIMGPIGWVVGGIMVIKRSWEEFNEVMAGGDVKSGVFGFFQKLGGVIQGAIEIWQTWNGETFTLSQSMHDALERIGILDFVLNLGTWVVRVKEFIGGLWSGISSVGEVLGKSFGKVFATFGPLFDAIVDLVGIFFDFDSQVSKNTSSIDKWFAVGQMVADFMVTGLKVAIEIIAFSLTSVITGITLVVRAFTWLFSSIKGLLTGELSFADVGKSMVEGISEGIIMMWDNLKSLLMGLIEALPFGDKIMDFFDSDKKVSTEPNKISVDANETPEFLANINRLGAQNRALSSSSEPTIIDKSSVTTENITNVITLDGEEIHKSNIKRDRQAEARE